MNLRAITSIFILADDLSGAADCAVGAAQTGLRSVVMLGPSFCKNTDAQVVAIDADTRYLLPERASAVHQALWRTWTTTGQLFYKKIDSTLRGNFAAEIAALSSAGIAIVAPAFPKAGRTTVGGHVFVDGAPLEVTDIWKRECMQGTADLVAMLQVQGVMATNIELETVRDDLGSALKQCIAQKGVQAIVCDAQTDADLSAIAHASMGLPVYWVGSAGLVAHLTKAVKMIGCDHFFVPVMSGPIVTVVGSLSAVSLLQSRKLETEADIAVFEPTQELLLGGIDEPLWDSLVQKVSDVLADGRDVLIRIGTDGNDDLPNDHALCVALGQFMKPLASRIGALVVTGGETARALLQALGVHSLQMLREIEPGVPLSRSVGTRSFPVITKAGAFGSPEALINAHRTLADLRANSKPFDFHFQEPTP